MVVKLKLLVGNGVGCVVMLLLLGVRLAIRNVAVRVMLKLSAGIGCNALPGKSCCMEFSLFESLSSAKSTWCKITGKLPLFQM